MATNDPRPRTDDPKQKDDSKVKGVDAPAGNAIYDSSKQTHRRDMPDGEQDASGEPKRGTAPPGTRRVTTESNDAIARGPLTDEDTKGR